MDVVFVGPAGNVPGNATGDFPSLSSLMMDARQVCIANICGERIPVYAGYESLAGESARMCSSSHVSCEHIHSNISPLVSATRAGRAG